MKKLAVIISVFLVLVSCSTTKEAQTSSSESRNEKKLKEQAMVMKAVESKRFIIKLERIYMSYGGNVNLFPRNNFIIIDGQKAIISAGYLGGQYDYKPIAGINVRGKTDDYQLTKNMSKGKYEVKMRVDNGVNAFNIFLTITKTGQCHASITNLYIDQIRYQGYIVPIDETDNSISPEKTDMI